MKKFFIAAVLIQIFFVLPCSGISSFLLGQARARVYEVGPGKALGQIGQVPWKDLAPGDLVLIHYRPEPYREKWVIDSAGTESAPIVVRGVLGPDGQLPVIEGRNAVTSTDLNFWSEERGIINIGGSNWPDRIPAWIVIENLDIRGARPPFTFRDDHGSVRTYSSSASSIYVIEGHHITIRNCVLHDCANGFFACHASSDILVEGCHIYGNGISGSGYQHNNYTEAMGIIFQFNHFGPLRDGCQGNNLKDRSAGTVIRYNWIEGGNRQLDLVDSDYSSIYQSPEYRKTYVYGNILVERSNEGNSQIIHYGGDSGDASRYRKGILYLFNNTVISRRMGNTTLLRLSTMDEECRAWNNIFFVTEEGSRLALLNRDGTLSLGHNWIKQGWVVSHEGGSIPGRVLDDGTNITGAEPGFEDLQAGDYCLDAASPCVDAGVQMGPLVGEEYLPRFQYVKHQGRQDRPQAGPMDLGAWELGGGGSGNRPPVIESFSADPVLAENPLTLIRFTSSVSDPDGDPVTSRIDFGDGTSVPRASGVHSYWHAGSYRVRLSVTDSLGAAAQKELTVTVEDRVPSSPEGVSAAPAE